MRVYQVMNTGTAAADVDDDIEDALELMHELGIDELPVTDEGRVVGVLTEPATRAAADAAEASDLPAWPAARLLMRPGAVTCHPVATVAEALALMGEAGVRTVYITDEDGRLLGSIGDTDLVDWYGDAETDAAVNDFLPFVGRAGAAEPVRTAPGGCRRI